jgi:hypothetical protein
VPALINYNATTHTLGGGQYDISGRLQIGSADITTLDSELDLELPTSQVVDGNGVNALQHLATVTANGSLSLGNQYVMQTPAFTNNGRVLIGNQAQFTTAGTYTQQGAYYTSIGSGAEFTAAGANVVVKSGYLLGDGFVGPTVVNSGGIVAPAQHLIVSGNYVQGAGGTLSTRVGGAASYDFYVGGTAWVTGTLAVAANSDLTPAQGMSFTAMRANSRAGNFTTVTSDGLTAPLAFELGTTTPNVTVSIVSQYDDVDPHVQYNGWLAIANNGGSASSFHASKTTGDSATFHFTGTSVTWSTAHTTESGMAQVLIDGVSKGTFDLYAAKNVMFQQTFSGLTNAAHTLVVKALGTKNAASSSTFVIVDNFTVGTTVTEDNTRGIQWDSWTGVTSGANGYYATTTAGAVATITVSGTSVDWVTRTGPDQGTAQLLLDGSVVKSVDLYTATAHAGVRYSVPLTSGSHVLTVKSLGTKNASSTAATVTVDGFVAH